MYLKAVIINETQDESLRILNAILPDRRSQVEVSPSKIALELRITESRVRYNVKKLVALGYLRTVGNVYEPTEKVLFLKK